MSCVGYKANCPDHMNIYIVWTEGEILRYRKYSYGCTAWVIRVYDTVLPVVSNVLFAFHSLDDTYICTNPSFAIDRWEDTWLITIMYNILNCLILHLYLMYIIVFYKNLKKTGWCWSFYYNVNVGVVWILL